MTILMIRPAKFAYNTETAVNNAFQEESADKNKIRQLAQQEFDQFVDTIRSHDINVLVVQDTDFPHTPDSIFPNNWISFHEDGTIILYPMYAVNRRAERKAHVLEKIKQYFEINRIVDLTCFEGQERFLEGTGSFVLDRDNKIAYACLSPRTDRKLFEELCQELGYRPVLFEAFDRNGTAIYHTNVMMCVADKYVVINMSSIPAEQRDHVTNHLRESGKKIILIDHPQMEHFGGNMLQVKNFVGRPYLIMSQQAWESLSVLQQKELQEYNDIIHSPLFTIERNGGGSARCMLAEIYLPMRIN